MKDFVARVIDRIYYRFDLNDLNGKPSNSKVMAFYGFTFGWFVTLLAAGLDAWDYSVSAGTVSLVLVMVDASFGLKGFMAITKTKAFGALAQGTADATVARAERDEDDNLEPSP